MLKAELYVLQPLPNHQRTPKGSVFKNTKMSPALLLPRVPSLPIFHVFHSETSSYSESKMSAFSWTINSKIQARFQ